jgi:hypothetical protein
VHNVVAALFPGGESISEIQRAFKLPETGEGFVAVAIMGGNAVISEIVEISLVEQFSQTASEADAPMSPIRSYKVGSIAPGHTCIPALLIL